WLVMCNIGYLSGRRVPKIKQIVNRKPLKNSWVIIVITMIISIIGLMLATRLAGGISGMFNSMGDRVGLYSGSGYLRDLVALGTIASILLLYKGYLKTSLVTLLITFFGIALFGARGPAIFYTVFPYMLFYHYMVKKINRKTIVMLGILFLFFVVIWGEFRRYGSISSTEMILLDYIWE